MPKKSLNNPTKPATKTKTVKGPVSKGSQRVKLTQERGSNSVSYRDAVGNKRTVRKTNNSPSGAMQAAKSMARKGTLDTATPIPRKGRMANKIARKLIKQGVIDGPKKKKTK
jgi:hypothetical protein